MAAVPKQTEAQVLEFKPKAQLMAVTPELARRWLAQNHVNRKIRKNKVALYARDMAAGEWRVTGESIAFDVNGNLADGQHRLHACVAANVPFQTFVVRNVQPDAQEYMDSGAKRSTGDALGFRGVVKHRNLLAATAGIALTVEHFGYKRIGKASFTNAEKLDWLDRNNIAEFADLGNKVSRQIDVSPSVVTYAMWRLFQINPTDASEFFHKAATGIELPASSPILVMRRKFHADRKDGKTRQGAGAAQLSIIFRAWNAWRDGRTIRTLPVISSKGGEVEVPEPH